MSRSSRPVLTVFFDGLKPEGLTSMPFLSSMPYRAPLRTLLGYSIACHASMYTGVYPDRHGLWFLWQRSPETSPFAWLRKVPLLSLVDSLPARLGVHKLTASRCPYTSYWGLPRIVNLPLRYWPEVDVSETRYWDEDGYVPGYPTVFERLRAAQVPYDTLGLHRDGSGPHGIEAVEHKPLPTIKPWTYLFVGEPDGLSHRYTQEGPQTKAMLRRLDQIVEARYREFESRVGEFDFIAYSDHGHIAIEDRINPYELFEQSADDLNRYMHLIDAGYLRLWFRTPEERSQAERVLANVPQGYILDEETMAREHVDPGEGRYGELIFYLNAGTIFSWTTFGYGRKQRSMHGYLPSHPESDGVFITNCSRPTEKVVQLVDILPTLLDRLGLPVPAGLDGQPVLA